jgi:hypothetical protein
MCGAFAADNPEESALFDLAMRENSRDIARAMLSAYDFTQFGHFVDVGGGNGTLIADLLAACGQATGTFLDLAHVVAGAGGILEQAGVSQRCKVLAGSFFDSVPAGGDVYVMKSILHDWDDREAHTILRNCQEAMHPGARLLIVERILAPPNQGAEGKLSDLNMLVNAGGRERTCEEFTALLAGADFEVRATTRLRVSASSLRRSLVRASEGRLSKAKRVCGRLTPPLPWGNGAMAERQSTDFAGRIQICLPRRAGRFPVAWQGQRRLQAPALPHSTRFVSVHGHSVSGRNDAPSRRIIALTCQRRER